MTIQISDRETAARLARRPWVTTPIRPELEVSFEFFPPGSSAATNQLDSCIAELAPLEPSFVSVTYGAGGTTQHRTVSTIESLAASTDLEVAGHLTCVGSTATEVDTVVDSYVAAGVRRIVALRGDAPPGEGDGTVDGGYHTAADLVAGLRRRPDGDQFDISVAAYPEIHPKAASAAADLENLERKFEAGADRAITQFFFDTDVFVRWFETVRMAGITAPIVAGIMPVTNFTKLVGFAKRCGTDIPSWMHDLFGGLDDSPEIRRMVAATVAAEQCRLLVEHGVRHFHFYTMNQPELSVAVCRMLGIKAADAGTESLAG